MKTHGGRAPQRMKGKQKKNGPGNKRRRKLNENKASESGGDIRKRKKKKKKHAYTKECSNGSQYAYTRCSSLRVRACVRVGVQAGAHLGGRWAATSTVHVASARAIQVATGCLYCPWTRTIDEHEAGCRKEQFSRLHSFLSLVKRREGTLHFDERNILWLLREHRCLRGLVFPYFFLKFFCFLFVSS